MRISVVVPSFNQVEFLPGALDSILHQSVQPHEVIVADGASTDGSQQVLADYAAKYPHLKWHSEPDEGPADAVNKGLAQVTGDIIGIQSSDDVYYQGTFARVAECFEREPEVGFVYGDVEGIDEHDHVLYRRSFFQPGWPAFFGVSMALPQSSIFFRKTISDEVGGWDGSIYGCDIDYWMRLLFATRAAYIPEVLSGWRRYEGQRTQPDQFRRIWDDYWRMIEQSPDVHAASPAVRRLARASKHILALRCPPAPSRRVILKHLMMGALLHPGYWRYNPRGMLLSNLPGFTVLRAMRDKLRDKPAVMPSDSHAPVPRPPEDNA